MRRWFPAALVVLGLVPATAAAAPGDVDTTFASPNGFRTLGSGGDNTQIQDVLVEPDTGKIVAAVAISGDPDFGIARFMPDGTLDPSFNPGGPTPGIQAVSVLNQIPPFFDVPFAIARTPDGKYVVAGMVFGNDSIIVLRFTADGQLDTSFDPPTGEAFIDVTGTTIERVAGVDVSSEGKVTVAATADPDNPAPPDERIIVVARLLENGMPDTSFDESPAVAPAGQVIVADAGLNETGNGMLVDPAGRTVVVGSSQEAGPPLRIFATRLTPSGSLDATFSGDGISEFGVGAPAGSDLASDVLRQADGRLVLAAQVDPLVTPASFAVVGVTDSGELDTGFGTGGFTVTQVGPVGELGLGTRMAREPGGRVVIAGDQTDLAVTTHRATLVRYEPNGALDTSYGSQGVAQPASFASPNPILNAVDIDAQGRAVVGGVVLSTPGQALLARFQGGPAPANTAAPAITGTAEVGQTLTCSEGTWSGVTPQTYAFEWLRDGAVIDGATSSTYTLADADADKTIVCRVTATSFAGSGSAESAGLQIVTPPDVTIRGKGKQDIDKLAVTVGSNEDASLIGRASVKPPKSGGRAAAAAKPIRSKAARKDAAAGKKVKLRIKFAKGKLRKLKKLLKEGAKLKAKIAVTATDAAGNEVVVRKTVKLTD
jgi:uncharacterized delta-60 repeat protein